MSDSPVLLPIMVIGDLMLDVSENGDANRLSPEAPVVILQNPVATRSLGGAGNTAANTLSLGHPAIVVGAVGNDVDGEHCVNLISASGLESAVSRSDQIVTTVKTRFLARSHQIMRLDRETSDVPEQCRDQFMASLELHAHRIGALVISDYDKGAISERFAARAIAMARDAGIPVVVDSKKTAVRCFEGCTVIAPNHHEALRITGTADPERAAALIADQTRSAVLVTLGADGMLIFDEHGPHHIPSNARDVADVTGAGDTVTAALAVALAEGATVREAAIWANWAAAEAVAHSGTYAVPRAAIAVTLGG